MICNIGRNNTPVRASLSQHAGYALGKRTCKIETFEVNQHAKGEGFFPLYLWSPSLFDQSLTNSPTSQIVECTIHLSWILILLPRLYFQPYIVDDIFTKNVYDDQYKSRTYDLRVISTPL